nr:RIP metalloprotease RseP [Thermoanaerobaculia bacterium]
VKLGGELPGEQSDDPRDFLNRPRWQRVLVYLAGPLMNIVLSIAIITVLFTVGISVPPRQQQPLVGYVLPGSPGESAGLAVGDRILKVAGEPISEFQQFIMKTLASPGKPLAVEVERGGEHRELTLTPLKIERYDLGEAGVLGPGKVMVDALVKGQPAEAAGFEPGDHILAVEGQSITTQDQFISFIQDHPGEPVAVEVGRGSERKTLTVTPAGPKGGAKIGVQLDFGTFQRYPFGQAFVESLHYNADFVRQTFVVLGKIFKREMAAKSALSGPIEMAKMASQQAKRGFRYLFHLMAFISISIAILNLLPIPILDGGQIAILLVESGIRRDLSAVLKERLAQAGGMVLLAIMALVLFFDLQKL